MPGEILSLVGALLVIAAVLALAYLFTRYVAGRLTLGTGRARGRHISVLEQIPVGKDQKLIVAKVGEDIYLLGATPGSITCLRRMTGEEAEAWTQAQPPQDPAAPGGMSFRTALERVIAQRRDKQ